jgi:hypothetical protein
MAKSYREIMRDHRIRFSKQMLDRWEQREDMKVVDYIAKRVIICLILVIIFIFLAK